MLVGITRVLELKLLPLAAACDLEGFTNPQ